MTKRWLGKKLVESEYVPGNWRWYAGDNSLTISLLNGWWVAQAATDGFIETSTRRRAERAARVDVEKRLREIDSGIRAILPKGGDR